MIRPLELFIGLRYTRAKRRNRFISVISLISMLGIFIAVWALIVVLSVMNGFGNEFRARILGVVSHVTVLGTDGQLADWQGVNAKVKTQPHVVGVAPYVLGQGMLAHGKAVTGTVIRGILPAAEPQVSDFHLNMAEGELTALRPGEFGIVVGGALARKIGASVGTRISLVVPQALVTPAGLLPRFKRFTVVGVFDVGMYEYDSAFAMIHIEDAAILYRMRGKVSGLRLKLDDLELAPRVAREIESTLSHDYYTRDWTREHANFFRALKIEKRMMLIILFLIVTVAAINIISTLIMLVTEKHSDIAILRTLGLRPASVMGVFMIQGTLIGAVGTLSGAVIGVITALNVEDIVHSIERFFNVAFLASDVYYITDLPGDVYASDVVVIAGASFLMSVLATLYPAWRAARVQPAEALRYE